MRTQKKDGNKTEIDFKNENCFGKNCQDSTIKLDKNIFRTLKIFFKNIPYTNSQTSKNDTKYLNKNC